MTSLHPALSTAARLPLYRCAHRFALRAFTAFVLLGGLAGTAWAADPASEASVEFEQGRQAAARGDYAAAAAAFLRAHRLVAHPVTLFNAALAFETAGNRPQAADAYAEALEMEGLPLAQTNDAQKRLERLRKRLGLVVVLAPTGSTISLAHAESVPAPARVHVEPGEHVVRIRYPDGKAESRKATVRTEALEIRFEHHADGSEPDQTPPPAPAPDTDSGPGSGKTIGWIAAGTGTALAATSAVLGLSAWSARDDFNASGKTDRAAHDSAESYRLWTNITLGAAVVAGGVGVYLLTRPAESAPASARRPKTEPRTSLRLDLGWGAVSATGTFE